MNHETNEPDSDDMAAREWQAQERALADERAGRPCADEPPLRAYRLIARVAGEPPAIQLPADFAQRTARAVTQHAPVAQRAPAVDGRFEFNLLLLLGALLGAAGVVVLFLSASTWLPTFGATAPWLGSPWPWSCAVCLGLSGLYRRWQHEPRLHA